MLPNVLDRGGFPLLAEGRLVDPALDLVVVLAIPLVQAHTLQEALLGDGVGSGEFLGDSLKVDWSVGEGRGVAVDIVGDCQLGVDFYGAKEFFIVAESVHVDADLACLYYIDSLNTSVS